MINDDGVAKVAREMNKGLASSRPQGAEGASQTHTSSDPTQLDLLGVIHISDILNWQCLFEGPGLLSNNKF